MIFSSAMLVEHERLVGDLFWELFFGELCFGDVAAMTAAYSPSSCVLARLRPPKSASACVGSWLMVDRALSSSAPRRLPASVSPTSEKLRFSTRCLALVAAFFRLRFLATARASGTQRRRRSGRKSNAHGKSSPPPPERGAAVAFAVEFGGAGGGSAGGNAGGAGGRKGGLGGAGGEGGG